MERIVVGVDGSHDGRCALRWADLVHGAAAGTTGLLLGSVSHQVTHHAACPVVIVRPDQQ